MTNQRKTSPVERATVKGAYLLGDLFKLRLNGEPPTGKLISIYDTVRAELVEMTEQEMDARISRISERQLERLNTLDWHQGYIEFTDMGPWPALREIDIRLTTGNIVETAAGIRKTQIEQTDFQIPGDTLEGIISIQKNISFVKPRFPLILVPGGLIRTNSHYTGIPQPPEGPEFKIFDYDIDDGNTRAVAFALEGLRGTNVYLGKPKN